MIEDVLYKCRLVSEGQSIHPDWMQNAPVYGGVYSRREDRLRQHAMHATSSTSLYPPSVAAYYDYLQKEREHKAFNYDVEFKQMLREKFELLRIGCVGVSGMVYFQDGSCTAHLDSQGKDLLQLENEVENQENVEQDEGNGIVKMGSTCEALVGGDLGFKQVTHLKELPEIRDEFDYFPTTTLAVAMLPVGKQGVLLLANDISAEGFSEEDQIFIQDISKSIEEECLKLEYVCS